MKLNRKQVILKAKTEHPTLGYEKLAILLGYHKNTVRYHLSKFYANGAAKRHIPLSPFTKREAVDLLGGVCLKCGYNACLDALEFHHKGSDKDADIAYMFNRNRAREVILKEIAKCELLCCRCHREHHYAERMQFKRVI